MSNRNWNEEYSDVFIKKAPKKMKFKEREELQPKKLKKYGRDMHRR